MSHTHGWLNDHLDVCWLKPCITAAKHVFCCPLPSAPLRFLPGGLLMTHVCFPQLATLDISEQDVQCLPMYVGVCV